VVALEEYLKKNKSSSSKTITTLFADSIYSSWTAGATIFFILAIGPVLSESSPIGNIL
jgi:hypothetical protein